MNKNKTTTNKNLQDAVNVVLRGKLIAVNAYIKKCSQMDNITLFHEELEKKTKLNSKLSEGRNID